MHTYSTSTLPTVTIDNVSATVYGAALAPGFAGLYQVAIQVPGVAGQRRLAHSGEHRRRVVTQRHGADGSAVDGQFEERNNMRVSRMAGSDVFLASLGAPALRAQGIISTVAGNGNIGDTGDGGPATSATLGSANGIAVDKAGNIYFADSIFSVVRKVDSKGIISTFRGRRRGFFGGRRSGHQRQTQLPGAPRGARGGRRWECLYRRLLR